MSNLNEEDIAKYMENESIVKLYQFNDDKGHWQQMISYETVDGAAADCAVPDLSGGARRLYGHSHRACQ